MGTIKNQRRMIAMKVGYVRASTEDQNTIRQEKIMTELGVEKIYIEKVSGKSREGRPELEAMMNFVREGDVVVVESISRFARSTKDLLNLVEELKEKGVEFVSQKEAIDTQTPQGKFMLTVFGAMAELEREQILQRQKEGIAAAKEAGKYKGRKPIEVDEDLLKSVHNKWYKNEITTAHAIKKLGVSRNTFYRRMWEYEDEMGIPRKNNK
jgi:DNA invertase Pin-like site-specific DNA recombinase